MPILKKQAEENLERGVQAKVQSSVLIIDKKLEGWIAGDRARITLVDLDLSGDNLSNTLLSKTIIEIKRLYVEAGWKVEYVEGNMNGQKSEFYFS